MDNEKLLKRLQELELEVQRLKTQVAPSAGQTARVVKKSITFVLSYWTLLSFLVAIAVAIFIKWKFDVDYFENYRTIAESRKISAFHQKLGEKMLMRQEWASAEDAFGKALEADKNNTEASYGLVKSRIFKPLPGEKFAAGETQDIMISFLREQRPEDPDLDFLQASRYWTTGDTEQTKKYLMAALAKRPDYGVAQMFLSHISSAAGDLNTAVDWCRKALANMPDDPGTMSNLAWFLVLQEKFAEATPLLEKALLAGGSAITPLVLADALRMQGKFEDARRYSQVAVRTLMDDKLNETRLAGGEWYFNYLSEKPGDGESWKRGVYAQGLPRKQAMAQFSFALDSALCGNEADAAAAIKKMREKEPTEDMEEYYANKLRAAIQFGGLKKEDPRVLKFGELLMQRPGADSKAAEAAEPSPAPAPEPAPQ